MTDPAVHWVGESRQVCSHCGRRVPADIYDRGAYQQASLRSHRLRWWWLGRCSGTRRVTVIPRDERAPK